MPLYEGMAKLVPLSGSIDYCQMKIKKIEKSESKANKNEINITR